MMLWLDSKYVSDGLDYVLMHGFAGNAWANHDLWRLIEEQIHQLGSLVLTPRWIPSHLDEQKHECGFEEWVSHWNNRIDRMVGQYNTSRSATFLEVYARATAHFAHQAQKLRQLRSFYLSVAASQRASASSTDNTEPAVSPLDFVESFSDQPCLQDLYINELHSWVHDSAWEQRGVQLAFVELTFSWMLEHSSDDHDVYPLSFVQLVFHGFSLQSNGNGSYPFWNSSLQQFDLVALRARFERPTLTQLLCVVRKAVAGFLRHLSLERVLFKAFNKVVLRATKPLDGIFIRLDPEMVQSGQDLVRNFSAHRPLRKACDFARPV
jgi:hypothetical protein